MNATRAVILRTLAELDKPVNTTRLVKLVYLMDYLHFQFYGRTMTGLKYMWDHFGPNAVGHAIADEANSLAREGKVRVTAEPNIHGGYTIFFAKEPNNDLSQLAPAAQMILCDVLAQYGRLSTEAITKKAKETAPFKSARQYDLLEMRQSAPAVQTTPEDLKAYQRDLKVHGVMKLSDLDSRRAVPN